jgi:hypothetical protein
MQDAQSLIYGNRSVKQGDIIGLKLDMSAGTINFILNGKDMGVALTSDELKSGEFYPAVYTG